MSRSGPVVAALALATALLAALPSASHADPVPGVRVRPVVTGHHVDIDPAPDGLDAARRGLAAAPSAAAYGLTQTFLLHSLPGATRTIYLDFDGMDVSGTRWNSATDGHPALTTGVQPGWSLDASPGFSDTEKAAIQDIWQAVAEDYAPFGVDVTTEQPSAARLDRSSSTDQEYGVTALVTGAAAPYAAKSTADDQLCNSTCGGLAYNSVFAATSASSGSSHGSWQPAFVFPEELADDTHAIADAVSHEVGHNFGLEHDGTGTSEYYAGQGAWGPIMGAPSNYPITQWSKGEYAGANETQDDLAIIGSASGAPTRPDDAANTVGSASPLPAPAGTPAATGIISSAADVDVYSLGTCTGRVGVSATPAAAFSPDLDLSVAVLGTGSTALAGPYDAPTTRTNARVAAGLSATLGYDAGTTGRALWVAVDGVGSGNPQTTGYTDYGSLGRYLVSVDGACTGSAGAPSSPRGVTAVASGTSLTVSWSPPAGTGGSAITAYNVSLSPSAAQQVVGASTTSVTFTGLTPGQQYAAMVVARNADSLGPPGSATATVPADVPGAPTQVRAAQTAADGVVLSWAEPDSDGGAEVTDYRIVVPGVIDQDVDASVAGLTVTGLRPGQSISFSVQARNSVGLGAAATVAYTAPGGPVTSTPPAARLTLLSRPSVKGVPRVGSRLTVRSGSYSGAVTMRYQWYAAGVAVPRATRSSYRPRAAQVGRKLSVRVTATAAGSPTVVTTVGTGKVRSRG